MKSSNAYSSYYYDSFFLAVLCITLVTVHGSVDNVRIVPQFSQVMLGANVDLQCKYDISDKTSFTKVTVHWYMRRQNGKRGLWTASQAPWKGVTSALDDTAPDDEYRSRNAPSNSIMHAHYLTILEVNDMDSGFYFCTVIVERINTAIEQSVSNDSEIVVEISHEVLPLLDQVNCGKVDSRFPINADDMQTRIVGGTEANPHSLPWQVGLQTSDKYIKCGGTLISRIWVVSAAHCFLNVNARPIYIIAGAHDRDLKNGNEQTRTIVETVKHPEYRICYVPAQCHHADIILLRVDVPFNITHYVKPACVAVAYAPPGERCITSGWGYIEAYTVIAQKLQMAWMPILSSKNCYEIMGSTQFNGSSMICSALMDGGRDSCAGDSGGPFVCPVNGRQGQWAIQGVVSWGNGCAEKGQAGVYTRVTAFIEWIREITSKNVSIESEATTTPTLMTTAIDPSTRPSSTTTTPSTSSISAIATNTPSATTSSTTRDHSTKISILSTTVQLQKPISSTSSQLENSSKLPSTQSNDKYPIIIGTVSAVIMILLSAGMYLVWHRVIKVGRKTDHEELEPW